MRQGALNWPMGPVFWRTLAELAALLVLGWCLGATPLLAQTPEASAVRDGAARKSGIATASAAKRAFEGGDFRRAADLYWQAHLLDPADGPYLFALARCLHADGQLERAARRYREFLALPTGHVSLRPRAAKYLQEVEAELERQAALRPGPAQAELAVAQSAPATATEMPAQATPADRAAAENHQQPQVVVRPLAPARPGASPWPRRLAIGSGAALIATGAAVFGVFAAERWAFEQSMQPGLDGGKVTAFASRAEASQRAAEIANRQNLGLGLLAGGAAAMALGLWWGPDTDGSQAVVENLQWRTVVGPGMLAVEGRW